jgi:2-keto-3-deoxy-L-rhamnonate aldolase RhmA
MQEGRLAIGTHCFTEDIGFYEMCGPLGYDYVWIDNEHAGITNPIIRNGIVGTNAGGCAAFVRVRWNDPALVKPVLENGPDGIIFPMINKPEEAEKAVKSCLYPPAGTRGFGPLRGINYGIDQGLSVREYAELANKSILKIIQAEHHICVENLERILEVPGIDLVICGPMDLSASVGKIGELTDGEVVELMSKIMKVCRAAKIPFGLSIGFDMDLVKFWIDGGASFISMGTPYDYFRLMGIQMLKEIKSFIKDIPHPNNMKRIAYKQ